MVLLALAGNNISKIVFNVLSPYHSAILSVRRMHESVDGIRYLSGLIKVVEVTGIFDPFHLDMRAFHGDIRKNG